MRAWLAGLAVVALAGAAQADEALAQYGTPKYKPGFAHFDYVNPDAPKGGTLKLSYTGSFDSVNPFILKGVAAPGVGNYVFQSLMQQSYDEPQSFYPLIAQSVKLAPDKSWIEFTLDPKARWSDGQPITVDDVLFSFTTLKDKGNPVYKVLFKPIASVTQTGPASVKFTFSEKNQRELPIIAASLPVIPKHYYEKVPFEKTSLEAPIGSGPYVVSAISPGHSITFTRIKNYWAQELPSQKGLNNFDTISIDVYRDDVVSLEGLKSGQFDYFEEFIARNWATAYNIPAVKDGRLIKTAIPHRLPRGMQAFLFNTREAKFADPRVREAIDLTLDFEWMNRTLFYGAYTRSQSFFQNTDFANTGLPTGDELKLLEPYKAKLPPELFTMPYVEPVTEGTGVDRAGLIKAQQLLDDAGWVMKNGKRVNAKTGEPLTIEFLMTQRTFERVVGIMRHNLQRLGIDSTFRYVDESQYQRRVDKRQFDIVSIWWNQGLFYPGSEQYAFWHSSQADVEGSQNLGGVKDPVVDALVDKVVHAPDLNALLPASRALDRVLLWNHYVIPHWYINTWRILYWNKFGRPKITPSYNVGVDSWWALDAANRSSRSAEAARAGAEGERGGAVAGAERPPGPEGVKP